MKIIRIRLLTLLYLLLYSIFLYAQKVVKTSTEYTYYAPENVTLEIAKNTALERAKLQAIEEEFGAVVLQSNTSIVTNQNGKSNTDFYSSGGSEVKGEWIETIEGPQYDISYEQGLLVVKVVVSGRIREIISASVNIKALVLRNGTEDKFESDEFRKGDDLFLSFQSPKEGYLAVYLLDAANTVYCLLPYRSSSTGIYPIEANRSYIFFSSKHVPDSESHLIDQYTMETNSITEQNQIYIIYSPHSFVKAVDYGGSETLPRELPFKEFQEWLVKCRKHDIEMQVIKKSITIRNT